MTSIAAALRDLEIAEHQEALAHDDLLDFTQLFTPGYHAGWVHREVANALMGVVRGVERKEGPRVMVFLPPGIGKSQLVSRCLPPWTFGRHPSWEIVCATYGQDLSSDLGSKVRAIMQEPRYGNVFPDTKLDQGSQAKERFDTTAGGNYRAVGVGGALAGRRAHLLVIDDPVKGREEADSEAYRATAWDWYSSVARTRLYPGAGIVLLMTRYHESDLAGMILDRAKEGGEKWTVIRYPAIAEEDEKHRKKGEALHPERYPVSELEPVRRTIAPRDWLALYQQRPVGDEGGYFQKAWMRTYDVAPEVGTVHLSADFAYKTGEDNDRTCITAFGMSKTGDVAFLPGMVLDRLETTDSVERLLDLAKQYGAHYVCMGRDAYQSIGPFLGRRMRERGVYVTVREIHEKKDKQSRARSFQARMQQGKVLFPSGTLWNEQIQPELLAFPGGKHDDCVDACANAFWLLDNLNEPTEPVKPAWKNPDAKRWQEIDRRSKTTKAEPVKPLFG